MKRILVSICILLTMCVYLSTGQVEPEDRIEVALQKKIDKLRKEKEADCRRLAIEKAETYVDSIIAFEVTHKQLQTKGVPPRPPRPSWNAVDSVAPLDMELEPLLRDSL